MSGPAQVVSTFDTAVAAFEIRCERELDSTWRDLAGKTREAILGEGLETDAHPVEKHRLLWHFCDDASDAIAAVVKKCFPTLLEVATAQREHLGGLSPLSWTEAKISTLVCNFLAMDEKFDETSTPRDSSRVLGTAERIITGGKYPDEGPSPEFRLPGWAKMTPAQLIRSLSPNSHPANSTEKPLSRADTLEWVKWKEWWIRNGLKLQISESSLDSSLDAMIEAGKNGMPASDLAMVAKKRFFRSGDTWTVSIVDGESGQFPHLSGLDYLWAYVRHGGQELGVSQVQALCNEPLPPVAAAPVREFLAELSGIEESDASSSATGDDIGEAQIDNQTIKECRDRAREIEGEISAARRQGQEPEVQRLMGDLEKITGYLHTNTERVRGYGQRRPRRFSNENEKARQRISQAIKRVFVKLTEHHCPKTLNYFEKTLVLGQTGCFKEDSSDWQLVNPIR
jgi:hypothetical protein